MFRNFFICFILLQFAYAQRESRHAWRQTSEANRYFAHTLFQRILRVTPDEENVLISPYAVSAGLSMLLYGSDGQTADQLVRTLQYTEIDDARQHPRGDPNKHIKIARLYQKMKEQLIDIDHGFILKAPNKLFVDQNEQIQNGYVDGLKKFFGTNTSHVDFRNNPASALKSINKFVYDATNGTISEAVEPDSITPVTRAVMVSTLYFKADWLTPFDSKLTKRGEFTLIDQQSTVEVDYMNSVLSVNYGEAYGDCEGCLHARYIEIPYKTTSSKYKMVMELLLPNKPGIEALNQLEATLDEGTLYYSTQRKYNTLYTVEMPKFEVSYSRDLRSDLQQLGIQDMFDSHQADFSLINGKNNLYFTNAQHKTFLKVDEKGTTASAAFAASQTRQGRFIRFDRPFLLIIREVYTKMPLFMARISNPTA